MRYEPQRRAPGGPRHRRLWIGVVLAVAALASVTASIVVAGRDGGEERDDATVGLPSVSTTVPSVAELPPVQSVPTAPVVVMSTESSRPMSLPPDVVAAWAVDVGTSRVSAVVVAGSRDTIVAAVDRPGAVVALDVSDGTERWRAAAPGDAITGLHIVEGVVVVAHVDGDGLGSVRALDVSDGRLSWERSLAVGERLRVPGDGLLLARRRSVADRPAGVELLDPRTGEVVRSVVGDDVRIGVASVQRVGLDEIEHFDPSALRAIGVTALPPYPTHSIDVVLGGVRITTLPGEPSRSPSVLEGAAVATGRSILMSDEAGFRLAPGTVTDGPPSWQGQGRVVEIQTAGPLPRLLVEDTDGSLLVRSLAEGGFVAEGEGSGRSPEATGPRLTADGALVTRDDGRLLVGLDAFGSERWRLPVPDGAIVRLVDRGVVLVESGPHGARLTLLRAPTPVELRSADCLAAEFGCRLRDGLP